MQTYGYDVFGETRRQEGTVENDYLFTARRLDSESGLYYYRSRMYDPRVGRFSRKDDHNGNIWSPLTLHKYTYVNNNPANRTDPSGEISVGTGGTIIAGVAVARCLYAIKKAWDCCNEIPRPELPECPEAEDYLKYDQKMDIWRRRCLIHCWYRLVPRYCTILGAGPSPTPS